MTTCSKQHPDSNLSCVLQVILVELEEISPAQLALFPESVRHLRKKQGAVCWWKNLRTRQRWRTCVRRREDEEKGGQATQLSPSLSPSSRFWKELRFSMPVRGKRASYPEKTALLNLWWEYEPESSWLPVHKCVWQRNPSHTDNSEILTRSCEVNAPSRVRLG